MKTNINIRIENMIKDELELLFGNKPKEQIEDFVDRYRDANFLSGQYDHIFLDWVDSKTK